MYNKHQINQHSNSGCNEKQYPIFTIQKKTKLPLSHLIASRSGCSRWVRATFFVASSVIANSTAGDSMVVVVEARGGRFDRRRRAQIGGYGFAFWEQMGFFLISLGFPFRARWGPFPFRGFIFIFIILRQGKNGHCVSI